MSAIDVPRCRAPFSSMEFAPDGSVLVCCANYLYPIGLVGRATLRDIWTGPAADRLRSAVSQGDLSLGCTICSHRIRHDGAELPLMAYSDNEIGEGWQWPTSLSFSLHSTCNLECVMCGADRSTRIRSRRHGLPPLPHHYGDAFFSEIEEFVARASWCDFVGGEPLLVSEHWRVWDVMRSAAPGIRCSITTNGTVWNDRVEQLLSDFPTSVRVSVDGMRKETFESIRVGSDFESVLRNVERFRSYCAGRGTELSLAWSFLRQNWSELGDCLLWAESLGVPVYVTTVLERDFGVQHLPTDDLRSVHAAMSAESERIRAQLRLNRDVWDRQLAMIAAELAVRSSSAPREACFDAPGPDSLSIAAETLLRRGREVAAGGPDLESYHAAWGRSAGSAGDAVRVAPDGSIVGRRPGRDRILDGIVPGTDGLGELFDLLCRRFGGQLWLLEELVLADAFVLSVGIGPAARDAEPVQAVRLVCSAVDDGLDVEVIAADRAQHLPVPVEIRTARRTPDVR